MKRQVLSILVFSALLISCQNNARLGDSGISKSKNATPAVTVENPDDGSTSDEPTSDEPTGDEPTGDEPTGDEPTADEPTGDEPTADITAKTIEDLKASINASDIFKDEKSKKIALNEALTKKVLEATKSGNLEDIFVAVKDGKPVVKYFKLKGAKGYSLVTKEMTEDCGDFESLITHLNSEISAEDVKVSKKANLLKVKIDNEKACAIEADVKFLVSLGNLNKIYLKELNLVNKKNGLEHANNGENMHEALRNTEVVLTKKINEYSKAIGSTVVASNLDLDVKFADWNFVTIKKIKSYKKVSMDYDNGSGKKTYISDVRNYKMISKQWAMSLINAM